VKIKTIFNSVNYQIEKAKNGDRIAQRYLYDNYASFVLGVTRRYIADINAAEDVMMASFVKMFKGLASYEAKGSFEAWLSRIASYESISYLRAQKKHQIISPLEWHEYEISDDSIDIDMDAEQLQWMIDRLPDGCRSIFLMYVVDGYKHQEIADLMNISEGTSKSQVAYARKLLKSYFTKEKIG
jgi:RNA polymerase sigma factor (sigma-70 family)